jgi:hypothetical protein
LVGTWRGVVLARIRRLIFSLSASSRVRPSLSRKPLATGERRDALPSKTGDLGTQGGDEFKPGDEVHRAYVEATIIAKKVVFGSFELIRRDDIKQITQAKATLVQFVSPGTNPLDYQRNSAEANQQRPLRLIDPLGKRKLLGAGKQLSIVEVTEVRVERVTRARRIVDLIRDAGGGGYAIPAHGHAGFEPVE